MMAKKLQLLIGCILVIAVFVVQFILPIQIARAAANPITECGVGAVGDIAASAIAYGLQTGLKFLGIGPEPVFDSAAITQLTTINLKNCIRSLEDALFKVALAKMKKRLLDRITDDTIEWINNGAKGRPRFVENFGDTLKDSANEALGDTAREIGLGKLCDEKLSLKLQINLRKPQTKQFRQEASCTLNKIVDNVNSFNEDFRNGGWIGYTEALSPNNNRYGLELLAFDKTYEVQTNKTKESEMETSVSNGYKGVKKCAKWRVYFEYQDGKQTSVDKEVTDSDDKKLLDPDSTFSDEELLSFFSNLYPDQSATPVEAECKDSKTTLPASTVGQQSSGALQGDKDIIANADDLTPYISAIFDAAINRIAKNGLEGIGIGASSGSGRTSPIFSNSGKGKDPDPIGTSTKDATYTNEMQKLKDSTDTTQAIRQGITESVTTLKTKVVELDTKLPGYIESIKKVNEKVAYLMQCEAQKSDNILTVPILMSVSISHIVCPSTVEVASSTKSMYETAKNLQTLISTVKGETQSYTDVSKLEKNSLIQVAAQLQNELSSLQTMQDQITQFMTQVGEIDKSAEKNRTQCLNSTGTYACPATF